MCGQHNKCMRWHLDCAAVMTQGHLTCGPQVGCGDVMVVASWVHLCRRGLTLLAGK